MWRRTPAGILLALAVAGCGEGSQETCTPGQTVTASSHIWNGITIYLDGGGSLAPIGRVVDTSHEHVFPDGEVGRAVLMQDDDGNRSWMKRDYLISGGFVVRCDDPAYR